MDTQKKIPLIIMITEFFRKEWRDVEMMKKVNIFKVRSVEMTDHYLKIQDNSDHIAAVIWEIAEPDALSRARFHTIAERYPKIPCVMTKQSFTPEETLFSLGISPSDREQVKFPPAFLIIGDSVPDEWKPYENVAEILTAKDAAEVEQNLITYSCSIREVVGKENADSPIMKIINRFTGLKYSHEVFGAENVIELCLLEELGLKSL